MQAEVGRPPGDHQNPRGQAGREEVERALAFFLTTFDPFLRHVASTFMDW